MKKFYSPFMKLRYKKSNSSKHSLRQFNKKLIFKELNEINNNEYDDLELFLLLYEDSEAYEMDIINKFINLYNE